MSGLRLTDGQGVVIKIRPWSPRLPGCVQAQRSLYESGYPCPEPLAGPSLVGEMALTAESLVLGGQQLDPAADRPVMFAQALAALVERAPPLASVASLEPQPPWAWPDPEQLWPEPDDMDVDLNDHGGPGWLDDLAEVVRRHLLEAELTPMVGHVDFESQNLRWMNRQLHVVHDWDSVAKLPETVVAGLASAVFTANGAPHTDATVAESDSFLSSYQQRRQTCWSPHDVATAWAAGLWVKAFNAKKAYVRDDPAPAERLRAERDDRLQPLRRG